MKEYWRNKEHITLAQVCEIVDAGELHHATVKKDGKVWDGLYLYGNNSDGLRGFKLIDSVSLNSPDFDSALALIPREKLCFGSFN